MIEKSEIDFATFEHGQPKNGDELVKYFDDNMELGRKALQNLTDDMLTETFSLKNNGEVLMSTPKKESISQTINHLVHHRGQLSVYMRLNDIAVSPIYGPSADDKGF